MGRRRSGTKQIGGGSHPVFLVKEGGDMHGFPASVLVLLHTCASAWLLLAAVVAVPNPAGEGGCYVICTLCCWYVTRVST